MSQIKTTAVEGDVAVSRHATIGGNANIQGNTTIKKNLKVEGWIDARNIKGPNKGIFPTVTKLREAYPLPHDGWWALVGNALPAPLYIADGGAWVATGESAGNPTIDSQQYNEAVATLDADLKALATDVSANKQSIDQIRTQINTIGSSVNTLTSDVSDLKTRLSNAETSIQNINNSKGKANGLASLDGNGKVPSTQLPGYVDDVVEFNAIVSGITPLTQSSNKKSTDVGCMVVYDSERNRFILAVSSLNVSEDHKYQWADQILRPARGFQTPATAIEGGAELNPILNVGDYWEVTDGVASLITSKFTYYCNWLDGDSFGEGDGDGRIPEGGKVYISTSDNKTYRWSGSQLVIIGNDLALGHTANTAFPGDEGAQLQEGLKNTDYRVNDTANRLRELGILICDGQWDGTGTAPKRGVWLCPNDEGGWYFRSFGDTDFYDIAEEEYNTDIVYNPGLLYRMADGLYRIVNDKLTMVGGASVGNTFNLTSEIPTSDPDKLFYQLNNPTDTKYYAPAVVYEQDKAGFGLQITFAVAHGAWKIYQYVGATLEREDVLSSENWLDLAGMSAGAEAIVNVNEVCEDKDYTMSLAIQALIDLRDTTGVNYLKAGLVITYRRDSSKTPHVWETKQFRGQVHDIAPTNGDDLWPDFGGGGGSTFDLGNEPEVNGTKALSTGGAYDMEQRSFGGLQIEPDPSDYIIKAVTKAGEPLGDSVKIPKSNGAGGQSGSTLTIYCDSAVWGAYGGKIVLSAAIKSVSYDGEDEVLGTIRSLSIIDPTTNIELWSELVNQPSSTSANDLKFEFDFTEFITGASSKDYKIKATDADGNERTRVISVTAVDVTCTCVQALNYSAATALEVGGREKSLPMYKFENNVSTKQGILVTTEMFYNGAWRELGTATVTDSYSHNISINPSNVFGGGEKLKHGSYPLRIQGVDIASGVEGNTIYTAVMCVDPNSSTPIVSLRYNDMNNGKVRLYDSLYLDVAAYTPNKTTTPVEVYIDGKVITTVNCPVGQTYNVSKQIQGYKSDGSKRFDVYAQSASVKSVTITLTVEGSAIDASIKEGAEFSFDFSTRSNSEADHTITDNGYTMKVEGSNWNSNGFTQVLGENVLRIAENVKAEIPYYPFASSALETSGAAIQMAFSTKSIKDKNAMLCECYDPKAGVGFYIKGNEVVLTVLNGTPKMASTKFKCNEKHTMAVVVEPATKYVIYKPSGSATGTKYAFVKLYMDGDEVASIGYQPDTNALRQGKSITWNSENGDFNLNYIMAYNSYMEWLQSFRNYLCKLSDVNAMILEYDKENVLDTTGKPSMSLMAAKGMPYYVVQADKTTFDNFDYALNGGTNTSDQFLCTLWYFNPQHPECNFKAINVLWLRQGTTSAQRTEKNDRFNLNKKHKATGLKATVMLLNPDDSTELGRRAILAAKHNKVFVSETGNFVDVITVKKDFSDSSMANDCGVCDMMNATFRALGSDYQTPAQRAFDGTQDLGGGDIITGLQMDHSTKNHPIAYFRATTDTLQDAWFQARGNWKEDKGEQVALGFKDTSGYNKGCLNYGDFIEFFGTKGETLAQTEARFKTTEGLDTTMPYLISQYCGRDYAIYRYKGSWVRSTGSMKQVDGKWVVTGDVLNPVSGYELLQYAGMDWWQGVGSVEDMMKPTTQKSSWVTKLGLAATEYPAWTYYFECMIDDDQLQEDLALGKKVPYDLFNLLRFFDSCDYSKVNGWQTIWQRNAYKYLSLESAMAYTAFTDYLAAVDQRAKNMQPMFFLEDGCSVENGVYTGYKGMEPLRMYLNKIYDCDTCNESDNDGGKSIDAEVDPNKPTDETTGYVNPYMGSGSVLFNNIDKQPECWNSNDNGVTTISLKSVVNKMRNQTAVIDGKTIVPFSPDGATYYFIEKRMKFWQKVVSITDCEHKYIDTTPIANMPYFYANHGLGLTSLPRFIEVRWAIRDGYYQTGDFFTNPLAGRVSAITANSKIYITAAGTGYFGIGNDASGQLSETVFLEAGQSHAFTHFAHDAGALLYIYQPARLSRIDLSEMSLALQFNDLSKLELAEEIILGGTKHTANTAINGFDHIGNIVLGDMPFLRMLDVSKTTATGIDAKGCPRVESIVANDTNLTTCNIAQTSPIEILALPATMTSLELVNLPKLTYPGGLDIASVGNITKLWVEGCNNVDTEHIVMTVAEEGAIREVRIPDINMTASVQVLRQLRKTGAIGLDATGKAYEESGQCSGITGRWILSELIEDTDTDGNAGMTTLSNYFPELDLINSQFSLLKIDDIISGDFCERYSNPENQTGADYNKAFVPSGHTLKIKQGTHAFKCTFNSKLNQMEGVQLSDTDFGYLNSGESFDNADQAGEGFDIFHHLPHHWYKGVNDYKNQKKYILYSTTDDEPLSTVNKSVKAMLSELLYAENTGVYADEAQVGETIDDTVIATASNTNAYRMDVEGMKQARWPGLNHARLGAVFTDADGKIVGSFIMQVSHTYFDFSIGNYLFCDVPSGAKWMYFTSYRDIGDIMCLAVDSSHIEAIEPEWTEHTVGDNDSLIGTYPITIDGLKMPRSLSGAIRSKKGDGNSTTSSEWAYDSDGNPTETPVGTIHYTDKDFQNSTRRRGAGYQLQDYEQHKEISNLWWALSGTTNEQAVVGNGAHDATLNSRDSIGMADTEYVGNAMNSILGLKHYVGCDSEWMDYIACNVKSYAEFYKNRCLDNNNDDPIDYKAHIYDPITKTERVVQTVTGNGNCVVRVVHGAKCDILASKVHQTDTSRYTTHYAAGHWLPGSRGRVVLRSGSVSNASGGLAYAYANYASSYSHTSSGGRLAFRGKFVIVG